MSSLERDQNRVPVSSGVTDDANLTPTGLRIDPTTKRLKVMSVFDGLTVGSGDTVGATDEGVGIYGTDGTDYQLVATDSDGHLQVDLQSADIEIGAIEIKDHDGTDRVAVNASNELQVRDDDANTDLNTLAGAVAGSEMQVDVVTMPSTTVTATDLDIRDLTSASDSVTVEHGITGIGDGVKTVASAGTDEALAGSTACKRVTIQAQTDNTGLIAVGASGVDATEATGTGIILEAGDVFEFEIDNLADIYIDSTVNGEGVRFTYFT